MKSKKPIRKSFVVTRGLWARKRADGSYSRAALHGSVLYDDESLGRSILCFWLSQCFDVEIRHMRAHSTSVDFLLNGWSLTHARYKQHPELRVAALAAISEDAQNRITRINDRFSLTSRDKDLSVISDEEQEARLKAEFRRHGFTLRFK
jgi:hypothetical protein